MPLFLLSIKADLENLTDLQPRGGCDDPDYGYFLKVSISCGVGVELKFPAIVGSDDWFLFSSSARTAGRFPLARAASRCRKRSRFPIAVAQQTLLKRYLHCFLLLVEDNGRISFKYDSDKWVFHHWIIFFRLFPTAVLHIVIILGKFRIQEQKKHRLEIRSLNQSQGSVIGFTIAHVH